MATSPFRLVLYALIVGVLCVGIVDILTNYETNSCEMTWMFEYPQYLKLTTPKSIEKKYPLYGLYYYTEGRNVDVSKVKFTGIPVLFIPGNAGSHKQVRSLGSVALRKAKDSGSSFHFDYFSLDLNEELSGLFGGVLQGQTEFAHECIKHVLGLYKGAKPPNTVVVVGHSMGGMIARALYTLPDFKPSLVHTIVTQATPHQQPVINLDPLLQGFYGKVNDFWQRESNASRKDAVLKDVTVFSSGGGFRDVLVRNSLTSVRGLTDLMLGISSMTMSVPRAWVSTDHLCHVWCKQIVLATKRAMFDMVNKNNKQVAVNPVYRMRAFHHHFMQHSGPEHFVLAYDERFALDKSIKWEIRKKRSWKLSRESLDTTRYSVVQLPEHHPMVEPPEMAFVAISNVDLGNWIGVCSMKEDDAAKLKKSKLKDGAEKDAKKECPDVLNMAPYGQLLPPLNSNKKVVHIGSDVLGENTHIVTVLPGSKQRVEVTAELYNPATRHIEHNVTSLMNFVTGFPQSLLSEDVIINKTEASAVFYNISLTGLDIPLQAYSVHLQTLSCLNTTTAASESTGAVLKFHVPWSQEHTYSFIRPGENGNISLKLQTGRPYGYPLPAQLHVYLVPACTYRLTVTQSWTELFGQFVRFYGSFLACFVVIQLIMVLSYQVKMLDEQGEVPDFVTAHSKWAQPWRVVIVALILRFMLTYPKEDSLSERLGLMTDDTEQLEQQSLWYPALPILLYLVATSLINLYAMLLRGILAVMGRVLGTVCNRCCVSTGVLRAAGLLEYLLLLAALPLAVYVCGTLALLLVHVIYIFKTLSSYVLARSLKGAGSGRLWSKYHVCLTVLLMLMVQVALNAPPLIVWAQNVKYGVPLSADPSRTTGILVTVAALLLAYADFPSISSEMFSVSSALLYCSSVAMVHYCTVSVYRVPYFINFGLLATAIPAAGLTLLTPIPPVPEKVKEKTS